MSLLEKLTQREYEVLNLLARGKQNREIAYTLTISEYTVERHVKHIFQKLAVGNRVEAANLFWKQQDKNT